MVDTWRHVKKALGRFVLCPIRPRKDWRALNWWFSSLTVHRYLLGRFFKIQLLDLDLRTTESKERGEFRSLFVTSFPGF